LIQKNRFGTVDITANHARLAGSWDVPHRDPFDRMLAAQSQIEQMPLLTRDPAFNHFGITTLW
jgi:PIN domain nuclease of toxin-antitoxin system